MKNLELKAHCSDLGAAKKICTRIKARSGGILNQVDSYYNIPSGRIKLREIRGLRAELIYYFRDNKKHAKFSEYEIIKLKNSRNTKKLMKDTLGVLGVVRKRRELFLYQNVRIHLDTVKELGTFVEFEAECKTPSQLKQAPAQIKFLKKAFGIENTRLIAKSYIDLIQK
jgi:predicted adenylyl cyclase CyaB